jgi:predicted component of type VI protein secretion system
MFNQNSQEALKKFQGTKNKEYEKTQKQIRGLIGALSKHQSETENNINREMNELKTKIDNIKEEVTHDMENLTHKKKKQKYKTQWKATPADQNKWKTESQNLKIKWKLKEKLNSY